MNIRNYDREMEEILRGHRERGERKTLLLHACCAPCASACLMRVMQDLAVTVFYYNPNITDRDEYEKRVAECRRLTGLLNAEYKTDVAFLEGAYEPELFFEMSKGLEDVPERGERCFRCYEQRLKKTAEIAAQQGFTYFATTLTLSPLKNAQKLNEIGFQLEKTSDVLYLPSDFKKRDGYRLSVELSEKYGLYRQNYCGCVYSARQTAGPDKTGSLQFPG